MYNANSCFCLYVVKLESVRNNSSLINPTDNQI